MSEQPTLLESLTAWIPAIVAIIALAGTVLVRFLPDRSKREPAWNELSEENRKLRGEVDTLRSGLEQLRNDLTQHKNSTGRKIDAFISITRDAANQWPETHEGPFFNPDDLAALEDTEVPARWRGRVRPGYGLA